MKIFIYLCSLIKPEQTAEHAPRIKSKGRSRQQYSEPYVNSM